MFRRIELRKFNIENKLGIRLAYIALLQLGANVKQDSVSHNITEIMCVKEGKGVFVVNGEEYNVVKNDMLIVNPDTLHYEKSLSSDFEVYIMGIENFVLESVNRIIPKKMESGRLLYFLEQLILDLENQENDYIENAYFLFSLIINELTKSGEFIPQRVIKSGANELCSIIKKYIDSHFLEDLSVEMLSRKFYANKTTLMHNFKKYYNIAVKEYIIKKRLEESENWLKISNLTVAEICYKCRFSNPSYFNKYFKSKYKMTPKEYKLKYKKEV